MDREDIYKMRNKGYVTVFVSLMLVVMIILVTATMYITDMSSAETKALTATNSAMSSELANYNRLIFDRYHILLLDKTYSGMGEGAIEQGIEESLSIDLGEDYEIEQVELSGTLGILDDGCAEFKRQIKDNFKYEVMEYSIDKILEKTDGQDEPVDGETVEEIDNKVSSEEKAITEAEAEKEEDATGEEKEDIFADPVVDPRDTLKVYVDAGIAKIILPDVSVLSGNIVREEDIPSAGRPKNKVEAIQTDFKDLDRMEVDSTKGNGWGDSLLTNAEAIMYASQNFSCLTDQKYDDTYLNLEMEYIVGGEDNDGANYSKVVDEILLIRFGCNLAHILTDTTKIQKCDKLALALTVEFPPAQPFVKYLLVGCWAYIESVADVYRMLRGHKIPFMKDSTTWTTDFESLANLESLVSEPSDDENGLGYKEYLMILMSLQGDKIYYRMLDLMQLNVTQPDIEGGDPNFRMSNAITAFGVNSDVGYKSKVFNIHEEIGY